MGQIHQVEKFLNNKIMFDFLKKYIIKNEGEKLKHSFYKLDEQEISRIEKEIFIPKELKQFYSEIGFGYMYDTPESFSVDRFLSPDEYLKINLRIDYYEFYPALNFYNTDFFKDYLIFFEVVEGNYLLINKKDDNGKNSILYIDEKIADSLEEFLVRFDKEGHYFEK